MNGEALHGRQTLGSVLTVKVQSGLKIISVQPAEDQPIKLNFLCVGCEIKWSLAPATCTINLDSRVLCSEETEWPLDPQ
jgi:hypothetical protein